MLEEKAGRLERKGNPTTPIYSRAGHKASKIVEERRLVSLVTTWHSTSKRCPRIPRRDATERNKAKLSPWTLSSTASAQAGRPRTARHKATREARVKALKRGTARQKHQLPSSRRHRRPGPPQRADTSCPLNKQTKRRVPRSTPPTGVLSRPACCHTRRARAQARPAGARL